MDINRVLNPAISNVAYSEYLIKDKDDPLPDGVHPERPRLDLLPDAVVSSDYLPPSESDSNDIKWLMPFDPTTHPYF